ncbi:hypothetical protein EYF80_027110 [Liparis tanakae]|uniref:Uncharacterized protein n=1 Tax=Liparis tanakae TaxID=230148 RepID=A0A4Z2HA24_9TELE|nr:hypothetical protein EYF80_027110 [Liparis tanakae]
MTGVKGKAAARESRMDERVTHLFISHGYSRLERSLRGFMCSDSSSTPSYQLILSQKLRSSCSAETGEIVLGSAII